MRTLDCKRCSKKYEGDPVEARVCTPCYKVLERAGWSDSDIMERYEPSEEDYVPEDEPALLDKLEGPAEDAVQSNGEKDFSL